MTATREGGKKKAGGTGKKGKVFLEDKLLSLMTNITDNKAAERQAKVDKVKAPIEDTTPNANFSSLSVKKGDKKKASSGDKKRQEKAKALDNAKKAIMDREKEKRDRKKARKNGSEVVVEKAIKKRVGFA